MSALRLSISPQGAHFMRYYFSFRAAILSFVFIQPTLCYTALLNFLLSSQSKRRYNRKRNIKDKGGWPLLNEMKYVYAVYQEKSFSKAAKKLYITQPALSAMVKKAEKKIGCPIFDRTTVPLRVTEYGAYYIENIEKILLAESNVQDYYQDLSTLGKGHLSLGGSSYFCSYVRSSLIGEFQKEHPGITIDLLEGNLADLKYGLHTQALDLIIETALTEKDESLTRYIMGHENIILAVPSCFKENARVKDYALTFQDIKSERFVSPDVPAVPLHELHDIPFLMMKPGNDMYKRGMSICRNAGFTPQIHMSLDQILTSFFISRNGAGAVFMRAALFRFLPETDNMVYYKLDDPLAVRPVYLASKKGRYMSRSAQAFLDLCGAEELPEESCAEFE